MRRAASKLPDPIPSEGGTGAPTVGEGGLNVPLGVHFDALLAALDRLLEERDRRYAELRADDQKAVEKALSAAELAVDKAEKLVTERLEGFPQFYATKGEIERVTEDLNKLSKDSVPEALYAERHRVLEEKINDIQNILSGTEGGKTQGERDVSRQQWMIGVGITVAIVVINLVFYLVTQK